MQSVTKRGSPHDLHITKEYRGLLPGFFSKDHLGNWHDHLVNYRRKKCRTRMATRNATPNNKNPCSWTIEMKFFFFSFSLLISLTSDCGNYGCTWPCSQVGTIFKRNAPGLAHQKPWLGSHGLRWCPVRDDRLRGSGRYKLYSPLNVSVCTTSKDPVVIVLISSCFLRARNDSNSADSFPTPH